MRTTNHEISVQLHRLAEVIAEPPKSWQRAAAAMFIGALTVAMALAASRMGVMSCSWVFIGMIGVSWYAGIRAAVLVITLAVIASLYDPGHMYMGAPEIEMFVGGTGAAIVVGVLVNALHRSNRYASRLSALLQSNLDDAIVHEQSLALAEARSRAMIETALDGILTIDERGMVQSFNPAAERIFGCEANEVVGRDYLMLVPEEHRAEYSRRLRRYLAAGQEATMGAEQEVVGLRKNGSRFPLRIATSEITLADSRLIMTVFQDLSERIKAEREVRLNERRYRLLAEATSDVVVVRDANGEVVSRQPSWEKYSGQKWPEYLGKGLIGRVHPDDVVIVQGAWDSALRESLPQSFHRRVWHAPSQTWRHCETLALPVKDEMEKVIEWITTTKDVEDRFQLAVLDRLRVTDERTRLIESAVGMGTWEWEPGGIFVGSVGLERLLGRGLHPTVGYEALLEVTDPADREALSSAFNTLAVGGHDVDLEFRMRKVDGSLGWLDMRGSYVEGSETHPARIVGICVDITSGVQTRHALSVALAEARETTLDLRRANAAKDEFLGLVSHELRTPLTIIRGNAEVLRRLKGSVDSELRSKADEDIAAEALRLQGLIENLLVLARLDRGQGLQSEPILLSRTVGGVIQEYRRQHPARSIVLVAEDTDEPILANHDLVEQVVLNLMSNADKYSPPDAPIEVKVGHKRGEETVKVLDRGDGLTPEEQDLIFQPFYRSERTAARVGGLGLGLSVCWRIIEAHGGRLWGCRRPDGGSEFGFALPAAFAESPSQELISVAGE